MMSYTCKICSGEFENSPDNIVLCNHHNGAVHNGCCVDKCSGDNKPCEHCVGEFSKKSD